MPSTLRFCELPVSEGPVLKMVPAYSEIGPVPVVVEPAATKPDIKKEKSKRPKKSAAENEGLWLRRKEAIAFLGTRSVLEDAERAGWLKAAVRRPRLVLYNRQEVLACAYRLSQGEYPD
jgi:hypothetical protein